VHSSQEKATIGDVLDSYAGSVFQAEIPLRMKEFDSMARIFEIIFPA
jgi:hypothetical protein